MENVSNGFCNHNAHHDIIHQPNLDDIRILANAN